MQLVKGREPVSIRGADELEVLPHENRQGAVGMFGTSWSGFNALQLAVERPPALRAVVASYATDDRWTDDVHYQGGALRLLDLVDYPLYMVAMNALPPVPAIAGDDWRRRWQDRIERTEPWLLRWLQEQRDGAYWRVGSIRNSPGGGAPDPGYARIGCPVMLVGGWADGYRNNTYRTLAALQDAGKAVEAYVFPDEHHIKWQPQHRLAVYRRNIQWFQFWLQGIEVADPVDAEQYARWRAFKKTG